MSLFIFIHRAEQISQSSRERKERMGAITTGNKPDLRIRLFLPDDEDNLGIDAEEEEVESDYDDSDGDDYPE